jgi:hypothetical protein
MALWCVGFTACGSDGPRAVGMPTGGATGTKDAAAGGSTGASDGGEVAGASDTAAPDGAADVSDVAIPDAAVVDDAAISDGPINGDVGTIDGPAMPAGPRPVKPSPGCGKGNRAEGIHYIESGGKRMLVTVRLPAGYDPDRPSPVGVAFPNYAYPQCTVQCRGFTDIDAITLFPMTWTLDWNEPEQGRQANILFFEDMIAFVKDGYCVDENRVFVAGAGMGARFAQHLACKHGDWLWQVTLLTPPGPHVDPTCQGKTAGLVIQSVEAGADVGQAVVESLAARNDCSSTPPQGLAAARQAMLAAYRANRPEARCVDWAGCARPVRLCLVPNRFNTPGESIQGYRGWPTNGGGLIGDFLDRLD